MVLRIGADIGGTFTDLILMDSKGALFQVGKVLTTRTSRSRRCLKALGW